MALHESSRPAPSSPASLGGPERYRTLLEINNALVANLTQEALFHAIAEALRKVIPFDRTAIFLPDPSRDVLRLFVLESSLTSRYFGVGLEMPRDSHVGRVFVRQEPLVRRDLATERQYAAEEQAYADGVRSYVIVPLVAQGHSVGVLAVASVNPGQYSEEDAGFFREVANQVALAVLNMRAYEEIAALKARLQRESDYFREEIHREHNFTELVGNSPALLALLRQVEQVAVTDSTVLITGETGTGKELIARAVHARSGRRERPLVKVNCSAISAGLVESELFGHVKGAFTGAIERRIGRFELADGGSMFLDEVGELPLETQVKLLRVLQEREFEPVGSSRTQRVNVRLIAATNRDLDEAVRDGRFRSDLFFRLNVFPMRVPPLREHRDDIPLLIMFFLGELSARLGKRVTSVSPDTMKRLVAYHWPGNVRELQNIVERAAILATSSVLEVEPTMLPSPAGPAAVPPPAEPAARPLLSLEEVEREHIVTALERTGWTIEGPRGAAGVLKLHPNTLRSRMQRLGITRPGQDSSSA
jgi:formate hydrogenlyase transcriptional activator